MWAGLLYDVGLPLIVGVIVLYWSMRSKEKNGRTTSPILSPELAVPFGILLLCIALFGCLWEVYRYQGNPSAKVPLVAKSGKRESSAGGPTRTTAYRKGKVSGTITPGKYRNEFFDIELPFGNDWEDASAQMSGQIIEKVRGKTSGARIDFALARKTAENELAGTTVLVGIERLDATGESSDRYLRNILQILRNPDDRPTGIKFGPSTTFWGTRFDRLSLTRHRDDIDMKTI